MADIQKPSVIAPLDPGFSPTVLFNRRYTAAAGASGKSVPLVLALERENGLISRHKTVVMPHADADTLRYVERLVKFLLWSRGGWRLVVGGPPEIGGYLKKVYSAEGERAFDCRTMAKAYGRGFVVEVTEADDVPAARERCVSAGGHLSGCRIGFDLGASDHKVCAVIDGEPVFSEEVPWDPKSQADPAYHYHHLSSALHRAAAAMPRVDAIGGSSAGVIVDNEIRIASLLRSIPDERFGEAASVFKRIREEWKVPLVVMNDGDVTALAGALSLRTNGMLGIAMGSSEAAGFMDKQGR
ncbi:MAG: ROK family protein, partial [Verrucomicrobiaceae bacterium]